jgi:hypothetical protein
MKQIKSKIKTKKNQDEKLASAPAIRPTATPVEAFGTLPIAAMVVECALFAKYLGTFKQEKTLLGKAKEL